MSTPRVTNRREIEIEQVIAICGSPQDAATRGGFPLLEVLRVWEEMEAAVNEGVQPTSPLVVDPRLVPCGNESAYRRHLRRGEPIDDACRRAHARTRNYERMATAV